jgi:hypothetical protein
LRINITETEKKATEIIDKNKIMAMDEEKFEGKGGK